MLNPEKSINVATPVDVLLAQKFGCGVKSDMTHYKEMKEDMHFNSSYPPCLDANYSLTNAIDVALFK
jgi:hypothetical protein